MQTAPVCHCLCLFFWLFVLLCGEYLTTTTAAAAAAATTTTTTNRFLNRTAWRGRHVIALLHALPFLGAIELS